MDGIAAGRVGAALVGGFGLCGLAGQEDLSVGKIAAEEEVRLV